MHLVRADLAGNSYKGCPIAVGIGDAGDEVRRPRSESRHADTGFSRQSAVHVSHEGGTLFMTDRDEFYF